MTSADRVALFSSDDDIVDLLRVVLRMQGFEAVAADAGIAAGPERLIAFLDAQDPEVVLVDIPPPYDRSCQVFRALQVADAHRSRRFVLLTTNERVVREWVGMADAVLIIEMPFDLDELLQAITPPVTVVTDMCQYPSGVLVATPKDASDALLPCERSNQQRRSRFGFLDGTPRKAPLVADRASG